MKISSFVHGFKDQIAYIYYLSDQVYMRRSHKDMFLTLLMALTATSAKAEGGLNVIGLGLVFRPLMFGLLLFSFCMLLVRWFDRKRNSTRSSLFRFVRAFLIFIICLILGGLISEFVFPESLGY